MLDDTFQGKRLCSAEQWVAETAGCLVQPDLACALYSLEAPRFPCQASAKESMN